MMKKTRSFKIKNKLIAIILSITFFTLAIAFTSIIIYEKITIQEAFKNKYETIALVVAEGLGPIISFGDQEEAYKALILYLTSDQSIQNAFVYDENDALYTDYHRNRDIESKQPEKPKKLKLLELPKIPEIPEMSTMIVESDYIHIFHKILEDGSKVGTLYLRVSIEEINNKVKNLIVSMILILLLLIPLSLVLAAKLQGIISNPILDLAHVTKEVSAKGNYSIRVEKKNNDEVGMLYDGFNDMMEQIHNRDIQRDRVESELKAAEFFLSSVMESMPTSLITIESDGTVTQWNKSTVQLTGIEAIDAKGKNLWELLPDFTKYQSTINKVLHTEKTVQFYKESIKIKQKTFYLNVTIFPLLVSKVPKFVIMVDNVTEIEIKEQQLRQSQKMETVGTLAGGLAHDFNNVLGGIIGTISLFKYKSSKNRKVSPNEIEKYFTTIEESANRASDMVQHLLSLTRKQDLSLAPTDLNTVIKSTVKICKNTFDKSIEINARYSKKRAISNVDSTQIEQSVLNLCINAAHAMTIMRKEGERYGGNLNISLEKVDADKYFCKLHHEAEEEENYWRISVQDTGIGMSAATLTNIFDPFFTTKIEGKGTGLGLAMVYNIVQRHKGFTDVYSQEGIGTTFHIYLPLLKDDVIETIMSPQEKVHKGEGLILVIDDEEIMRRTAKSILEECGYDIIMAENGEEGVEMYKKYKDKIKAVVLDMVMPKMSGKQTYIELTKINREIKVVLASGFRKDTRVESILKLGVKGFIQKPYTMAILANTIYKIIASKD